ncbi:MAG: hypothetical protein AB2693_29490 [Candidatus Thiodiazotropha sp.]
MQAYPILAGQTAVIAAPAPYPLGGGPLYAQCHFDRRMALGV